MLYTSQTKLAMRLAYKAHQGQVDKSGVPYIFHPYHIAEQMTTEEEIIVALLHDTVEDTYLTLEHLQQYGFSDTVVEAVRLLTHEPNVPYLEYIDRLKDNDLARRVKLADLRHNSDPTRIRYRDERGRKRMEKYGKAIALLEDWQARGQTAATVQKEEA